MATGSRQCEIQRVYLLFNIYVFWILFVCALFFLSQPLFHLSILLSKEVIGFVTLKSSKPTCFELHSWYLLKTIDK